MRTGLIVTTYNWPEALHLTLGSVARQTHVPDEVIVADDGSGPATRAVVERWRARRTCRSSTSGRRTKGSASLARATGR